MLLVGADVVHLASALLLRGPVALREMLAGIEDWLAAHEYDSIAQLRGAISQQNAGDPGAYARAAYRQVLNAFVPPAGVRY